MSRASVVSGHENTRHRDEEQTTAAIPDHAIRATPPSKRMLDLVVAIPALGIAAPIMVVAAILVRLTSPGPALYRQTRIGQGEQPFTMFKLRTMYLGSDDSAYREFNTQEILGNADPGTSDGIFKLEHDPRITRVGRLLRRLSIDELPQLWNVIGGEMSLVGPRPLLPWEVEMFTSEQRRRHDCAPGITGLWQVSGRSRLSTPDMLALDIAYVERQSLLFDLWILLRTPWVVLFDKGVR
jgi:lipopolysaccharide/colanic/teichoic acid biosynthesis glycosyltransferase